MRFTTKPLLGWEMRHAVPQVRSVRCRWVTCAAACGRDPDLLDRIAAVGLWSVAEVPHATRVWQQRVALTDGAEALQQPWVSHCPEHTLVLDIIHATEYLWDTANALLGATHPQRLA